MKLLLIEDSAIIQRMYSRELTNQGIEVIIGNDGSEAVPLALAHKPDVIMMDVMMPKMNGIDALALLKQTPDTKNIPVIMLSAYDDGSLLERAMHLGAYRYIVKSNVEVSEVVSIVNEIRNDVNPDPEQ